MARDVKNITQDGNFQEVMKWIERMNTTLGACKVCKAPVAFEPFVMTAHQYSPKAFVHQRAHLCFTCTECGMEAARFQLAMVEKKFFPQMKHHEFLYCINVFESLAEEAAATGCGKPGCPDCSPPVPPAPGVH